jgi:hypothetical protein
MTTKSDNRYRSLLKIAFDFLIKKIEFVIFSYWLWLFGWLLTCFGFGFFFWKITRVFGVFFFYVSF